MLRLFFETALALVCSVSLAVAEDPPAVPGPTTALDTLKGLAGEWVAVGSDGKPTDQVVSVFKTTAGGSAVQETIFPGTGQEMVTLYHRDGKDLVLTHYCMLGNQPRLKLDPTSTAKHLKFAFAGGTNFDPKKDAHMHEGSLKLLEDGTIEWRWLGYHDGQPAKDHEVAIKLVRKKK